jgi:predicted heme/steroid binding protein/uncharacterized membrane protein
LGPTARPLIAEKRRWIKRLGKGRTPDEKRMETREELMDETLDKEQLSKNDGKEGRPTYIAHGGRVFDVSKSRLWKTGTHMGRHQAGTDLTVDIEAAPHGLEVLDRYPQVGTLVREKASVDNLPPLLSALFLRYPFFKRHPHPASVHFPIVFTFSASFFGLLHALTGVASFGQTSFYCLTGALLFMPVAMATGLLTWWANYMARPMRPVTIKKYLSLASLVVMLCMFVWRVASPGTPGTLSSPLAVLYLVILVALSPAILIVAYYGGTLTFPLHKD